jgi:3-oxoacyl-[acyl-carrier protein] reductase
MAEVKATTSSTASLKGKVVLVTGASSGIGRAIALACARAGADVATTYRTNQPGAERVMGEVKELGRRSLAVKADIAREDEIGELVRALVANLGRVDVWINNAGADILTGAGAKLSLRDRLDLLLAVDLRGTILASWAAVKLMKQQEGGGSIINLSWDRATQGLAGVNPQLFAAVKGGVLGFSKSLARSVAPKIRVNVLGPGWIETAFADGANPSFKDQVRESIPLRRWGLPDEVAGAAVFLASDVSAYITGQMIMVNGGDVMGGG